MRFLSNAHTHTSYCDGASTVEELLAAARGLQFVSLGFSSHANQGFDLEYCMNAERQERYLADLRALQQAALLQKTAPRLWIGLEEDALTPEAQKRENRRRMDFIIGSTHYLRKAYEGSPLAVDGDPALLCRYVLREYDGDGLAMAAEYYQMHVTAINDFKPNIIGHFDLVRKYASSYTLFQEDSAAYRQLALSALERVFPSGGVLEVNTGAMARGQLDAPYPSAELLAAWRELGGEVTLTSDCHDAAKLAFGFEAALKLLARTGYKRVLRLGRQNELWEEVRVAAARA